jgi:hypothetical protein
MLQKNPAIRTLDDEKVAKLAVNQGPLACLGLDLLIAN